MSKVYILGEVAKERREVSRNEDLENTPIVGLEHIEPEEFKLKNWALNEPTSFTKAFKTGDVLFGRRRAYLKKSVLATRDGICSGDITVIKAKPKIIDPKLLPFILQNDSLFSFAVGKSAGSLSPRVKWSHLKQFKFRLPELKDQNKIANSLWAVVETIDSYFALIDKTEKLLVSLVFDKTSKENNMKKIQNICVYESKTGLKAGDGLDIGKYPFYTSSPTQDKWINNNTHSGIYIVIGTGGKASLHCTDGEFAASNDNFIFKSTNKNIKTEYIYLFLLANMHILEDGFRGSGLKHISRDYVNAIEIPAISIEEQNQLIRVYKKTKISIEQLNKTSRNLRLLIKNIVSKNFNIEEEK